MLEPMQTPEIEALATDRRITVRAALVLLRAWKRCVSPYLGNHCRFSPTCSEYAAIAICRFGLFRGCCLAVGRIARCNPFCAGGIDNVPGKES
jgi:uncharacterized protein